MTSPEGGWGEFKLDGLEPGTAAKMLLTVCLLLSPQILMADEIAARELANGDSLARDGKLDQARTAWRQVVERYPDSQEAPTALDRLGTAAYPVEDFHLRGRTPGTDAERALSIYRRIAEGHRNAPEAPRALFKLGMLLSDPDVLFYNLDESYGQFSALVTIYPESDYQDEGLYGLGDILAQQRQCPRAMASLSRLDAEFPDSPWADDGLMLQADCLVRGGYREEAMRLYQDLRDRFPQSPGATLARDRNTHLIRLLEAKSGPVYRQVHFIPVRLPEAWRVRAVTDMEVDPRGNIIISDGRAGLVHTLDRKGQPVSRAELRRPSAVWAGPDGLIIFADGRLVMGEQALSMIGPDGGPVVGPAGLLARDPEGRFIIWDRKSGDILRFTRRGRFDEVLVASREFRIDAAVAGQDGTIVVLDGKAMVAHEFMPGGGRREVPLQSDELRRPRHMSRDFLGNLYLLDTVARVLEMRAPDGRLLVRLTSGRADGEPFPRPAGLAVNGRGDILIYDERRAGIVVYR